MRLFSGHVWSKGLQNGLKSDSKTLSCKQNDLFGLVLIQFGPSLLHGIFYNTVEFEWLKYTHKTLPTWEMGKKGRIKKSEKRQQHWNSQRVTTVWCELWIMYKWMSRLSRNMLVKSARHIIIKILRCAMGFHLQTTYIRILQPFQPLHVMTIDSRTIFNCAKLRDEI